MAQCYRGLTVTRVSEHCQGRNENMVSVLICKRITQNYLVIKENFGHINQRYYLAVVKVSTHMCENAFELFSWNKKKRRIIRDDRKRREKKLKTIWE